MPLLLNILMQRGNINAWRSRLWNVLASLVTIPSPWITFIIDYSHCGRLWYLPSRPEYSDTTLRSHSKSVFRLHPCIISDSMLESLVDTDDTQLVCYLTSTWAKIGQALGVELESYLTLVMPYISSFHEEEGANNDRNGWETVMVDGKTMGIKICTLEEKCQAFETLLIYCSTLGGKYAPYLSQMLEICIPCLKSFMKVFGRPVLGEVCIIIHECWY